MKENDLRLRDARVLVNGARGFIARNLCRRLIEAGAIVICVSRIAHPQTHARRVRWTAADFSDLAAVETVMRNERPDIVFHLGGHVSGAQSLSLVQPTLARNLISAVNVLTAATEANVDRIIMPGSMHEPELDEVDAVACSPYAASQIASTAYSRMFHALYQTPTVTARMMMVYGPGQWDTTKLLPYVITSLLAGIPPAVASGTRMIDWVYVDDVVEGLISLTVTPGLEGQAFDLGTGRLVSNREIVQRVATIMGSRVPIGFGAIPDRILERPRAAQTEITWKATGWRANTDMDSALKRTVDWFRRRSTGIDLPELFDLPRTDGSDASITSA